MTGVIAVMKPPLESQRMYSSRVLLGSVAASAAMFCVLSLSFAAASSGVGFIDMPPAQAQSQAQCCFTVGYGAPVAGVLPGPQIIGRADHYWGRKGGDPGNVPGQETLSLDDTKTVGAALGTDKPSADGGTAASDGSVDPDTTNGGGTDAASTGSTGGEFTGNPEPAGPDLNSNEEKDMISSGWK
jgi:hypothetical protein